MVAQKKVAWDGVARSVQMLHSPNDRWLFTQGSTPSPLSTAIQIARAGVPWITPRGKIGLSQVIFSPELSTFGIVRDHQPDVLVWTSRSIWGLL